MTEEIFKDLCLCGETTKVQFKQAFTSQKEIAKEMIADGIVSVNGEVCTVRGKKLRPGDEVTIEYEDGTLVLRVE